MSTAKITRQEMFAACRMGPQGHLHIMAGSIFYLASQVRDYVGSEYGSGGWDRAKGAGWRVCPINVELQNSAARDAMIAVGKKS